jgi:hypothetical protein
VKHPLNIDRRSTRFDKLAQSLIELRAFSANILRVNTETTKFMKGPKAGPRTSI